MTNGHGVPRRRLRIYRAVAACGFALSAALHIFLGEYWLALGMVGMAVGTLLDLASVEKPEKRRVLGALALVSLSVSIAAFVMFWLTWP